VKANYLASPPLCVAYAIAGTVNIDLASEPLGTGAGGKPVYLKDIWPTHAEVQQLKAMCATPDQYRTQYGRVFDGNPTWNAVPVSQSELYGWSPKSTYIQNPPYFEGMRDKPDAVRPITGARCLVFVGDSVTTDHISPAGDIAEKSPAGQYLLSLGVPRSQFNSYGSRRGNDRVMTRGTFANVRVKNKLADENGKAREGWWTRDLTAPGAPTAAPIVPIYDASLNYKKSGTPLIVLAGKDYGMGSSRDWAAKGTNLLGVRAVISESFERIHRSNLVGMGVLPLCFKAGQTAASLGLDGTEVFDIHVPTPLEARCTVKVKATRTHGPEAGKAIEFEALCRIDTPVEVTYYENGGILHTVLRRILNDSKKAVGV
jgi:aconitate hydratase